MTGHYYNCYNVAMYHILCIIMGTSRPKCRSGELIQFSMRDAGSNHRPHRLKPKTTRACMFQDQHQFLICWCILLHSLSTETVKFLKCNFSSLNYGKVMKKPYAKLLRLLFVVSFCSFGALDVQVPKEKSYLEYLQNPTNPTNPANEFSNSWWLIVLNSG